MIQKDEHGGASVLVVDDTPANLQLLYQMLSEQGYEVRLVASGKGALRAIDASAPDLLLLDINMPEMNGYEVCQQLKKDEEHREIPVIFISALHEPMDKVKAFSAGGVDYVTKPFHYEEVIARVETHLKIAQLQHDLKGRNSELKEHIDRLQELERLRDGLLHMIVHDLRSPLSGLVGYLDLIGAEQKPQANSAYEEYLNSAKHGAALLEQMISSLLDVNRLESGQLPLTLEPCALSAVVDDAISALGTLVDHHQVNVVAPDNEFSTRCDSSVTSRIVENLISNAVRYAPENSEIRISIHKEEKFARVKVADSGLGIAPEHHKIIFEKFGQVQARESSGGFRSTGLGLAFCKLAVQAQGGEIGVESEYGHGSTFWFTLPLSG